MTPHKTSNGRGSFMIDRRFAGVGRIHRASGTTDRRTFGAIDRMLSDLFDRGHLDILAAIRRGQIKPLAAYGLFRNGGLTSIPDVQTAVTLQGQWRAWQDGTPIAETRRDRKNAWARLAEELPADAMVADLVDGLKNLRSRYRDHAPAFNRIRAAVMAFVRDTLGRRHALHEFITDIPPLKERRIRRPAPTIRRALDVRDALPERASGLWWDMYLTGMGPAEFDGVWRVEVHGIEIDGTKREARIRIVPRLTEPQPRAMGWKQYREALSAHDLQRYDARRGFSHLLEECGIPKSRIRLYMGHAGRDVTDGYLTPEVRAFLETDRTIILERIALEEQARTRERRAGLKRA